METFAMLFIILSFLVFKHLKLEAKYLLIYNYSLIKELMKKLKIMLDLKWLLKLLNYVEILHSLNNKLKKCP